MFAQGRELPRLRELTLNNAPGDDSRGSGLQLLVDCCSGLRQLTLQWKEPPTSQKILPLTALQHLLALELLGASRDVGGVLVQLTQLTKLSVGDEFDDIGLLHLTGLTRLEIFCRARVNGAFWYTNRYINKVSNSGQSADVQAMPRWWYNFSECAIVSNHPIAAWQSCMAPTFHGGAGAAGAESSWLLYCQRC